MEYRADVAVLGSGFGGSLTALILQRIGRSVIVVDREQHPRFAIGESSTPIADAVLKDLTIRYGLPALRPLVEYGTWKQSYPELGCGLKRGFSYFRHATGEPFRSDDRNSNRLLVAASRDDHHSDTHWHRADVDAFFAQQVREAGIPLLERTEVSSLSYRTDWQIQAQQVDQDVRIRASFLIDATGPAELLARKLHVPSVSRLLRTHSRAVFGHFRGVRRWTDVLHSAALATDQHPFDADAAALHHLHASGWMWVLRFDSGVTSAGLVIDSRRCPAGEGQAATEWSRFLADYPSVAEQFLDAECIAPVGGVSRTDRLQRLTASAADTRWAMLPNTAGFIDPMHSTGVAHSLCGIERLALILDESWRQDDLPDRLGDYSVALKREFGLIDLLVDGCYAALRSFELFAAWSMLYFTGAIHYEHHRADNIARGFLCANDPAFVSVVRNLRERLDYYLRSSARASGFAGEVAKAIEPWNAVGLCDPTAYNMYRYTAAPR